MIHSTINLRKDVVSPPAKDGFHLISVVIPCLNEERTLGRCIDQAREGCQVALQSQISRGFGEHAKYEIIVADNGSVDDSREIAFEHEARVVQVMRRGYGAALQGGIAAARGDIVVMGDADCSYDFGEILRFVEKLREGYDLVVGNRFAGQIVPGAMPWHHRYVGNPLLSGLGQLLYRTPCWDWHCGLRAFYRQEIMSLKLSCEGMEFASEMIVQASRKKLCMAEIPITLFPDARNRAPHLRSVRDGLRHLAILTCSFPKVSNKKEICDV